MILLTHCCLSDAIITHQQLRKRNIKRIYFLGDIHGSLNSLLNAAYTQEICDVSGNWIAHNVILIQVGDLIHRGLNSLGVVRQFMKWQQEAPKFNSQVIVLRGNHEEAEIRYSLPDYAASLNANDPSFQFAEDAWVALEDPDMGSSHQQLYESTTEGEWIRNLLVVQIIGHSLFVHAGIDQDSLEPFGTLEEVNKFAKCYWKTGELVLRDDEFVAKEEALNSILNTRRFDQECREFNDSVNSIGLILDHLEDLYSEVLDTKDDFPNSDARVRLDRMVVGHTITRSGTVELMRDKQDAAELIMVDTGYYQRKWSISHIDVHQPDIVYTYDHTMHSMEKEEELNRQRLKILRKSCDASPRKVIKRKRGTKTLANKESAIKVRRISV